MLEKLIYWLRDSRGFRIVAVLLSVLTVLLLCSGCGKQAGEEDSQSSSR